MMKRIGYFIWAMVLSAIVLVGCGNSRAKETELVVFAAASMTETMEQVAEEYTKLHPDVQITYNFDSSGTLKTQIEEGAECDLFVSAAPKQMNQLEELGLVDTGTRIELLENKVVLAVADSAASKVGSFNELADCLENGSVLFVMGNEDVPVGQYTKKILDYYGIDEAETANSGRITYAGNVKEVTTQILEQTADCGVIYQTDAYSAGLEVTDTATEEMCGQIIYPAAVLKNAASHEEAVRFLEFLTGDKSDVIFERVGFTPLGK